MPEYLIKFKNPSVPRASRTMVDTNYTVQAGLDELRSWCNSQFISFEIVTDDIGSELAALTLVSMTEEDYMQIKEAKDSSLPMLKFIVPNEYRSFASFDEHVNQMKASIQKNTPPVQD